MATFAERFKELREAANLTQIELAEKLNVSKGTIGNYEAGVRTPRKLEDLESIADFFQVEIDYLIGRTDNKPEFSLEEIWVVGCYRRADSDTQTGIKTILRKFDEKNTASLAVS